MKKILLGLLLTTPISAIAQTENTTNTNMERDKKITSLEFSSYAYKNLQSTCSGCSTLSGFLGLCSIFSLNTLQD